METLNVLFRYMSNGVPVTIDQSLHRISVLVEHAGKLMEIPVPSDIIHLIADSYYTFPVESNSAVVYVVSKDPTLTICVEQPIRVGA